MPKYERNQMLKRLNQDPTGPLMNQIGVPFNVPFNMHPNLAKNVRMSGATLYSNDSKRANRNHQKVENLIVNSNSNVNKVPVSTPAVRNDDPDLKYLQSFEDEAARRDYLGEFLFRKIENHPLIMNNNHTIDTIGKITGMILGIDDINEIIDITTNHENLSLRISEAINLIETQSA
jgi:hypothetical protein